jgi:hypothetical protein
LAGDNKASLTAALGREPDASELYLAHFLGADGASKFLNGLAINPGQSAAVLLPAAAASNRAIFFRPDGSQRSISEVMGLVRGKLASAMEGGDAQWAMSALSDLPDGMPMPQPMAPVTGGPLAQEFHATAQQQQPGMASAPPQQSMAQVLEQAFAIGTPAGSALPDHVRTAYAKLTALGL